MNGLLGLCRELKGASSGYVEGFWLLKKLGARIPGKLGQSLWRLWAGHPDS